MFLLRIVFEIVEFDRSVFIEFDELPVAGTDGGAGCPCAAVVVGEVAIMLLGAESR